MALTIGEANAVATLIHLIQGETAPAGMEITPARAAQSVELLLPKVRKTLMAGPTYDEDAIRRTTTALHQLARPGAGVLVLEGDA